MMVEMSQPELAFSFVAALSSVATAFLAIVIPVMLHRSAQRSEKARDRLHIHLNELQQRQVDLASRQRWEHLIETLPTVESPTLFRAMRMETANYQGQDRELLESAVRTNPLEPIPARGTVTARAARDFTQSLSVRGVKEDIRADALNLVAIAAQSLTPLDFEQLRLPEPITGKLRAGTTPGHQFYRDIVNAGSWRLAAGLMYEATRLGRTGHAANVITGVMLAVKDFHTFGSGRAAKEAAGNFLGSPSTVGWPTSESDFAAFDHTVRQALAGLLTHGDLGEFGGWDTDGLTDSRSAAIAWIIRAAGNLSGVDDHLDMRIMQELPALASSHRGHDAWGMDAADVRLGMTLLRRRVPELWRVYGPPLMGATSLEPDD